MKDSETYCLRIFASHREMHSASHGEMQSDLQAKLVQYMADYRAGGESNGISGYLPSRYEDGDDENEEGETAINFDELSPELQLEFQFVQARATEELGPLALERAVQMQRIVQAESYTERLDLLRECVDNERRRLEAKKMLQSLTFDKDGTNNNDGRGSTRLSREEARSVFERLMSTDDESTKKQSKDEDGAFQ